MGKLPIIGKPLLLYVHEPALALTTFLLPASTMILSYEWVRFNLRVLSRDIHSVGSQSLKLA